VHRVDDRTDPAPARYSTRGCASPA
jgi:hypothetical protein